MNKKIKRPYFLFLVKFGIRPLFQFESKEEAIA